MEYYVVGYFDIQHRGVEDNLWTEDLDEAFNFAWDLLSHGDYVVIKNETTGVSISYDPDDVGDGKALEYGFPYNDIQALMKESINESIWEKSSKMDKVRLYKRFDSIEEARKFADSIDKSKKPRIEMGDTETDDGEVITWYDVGWWSSSGTDDEIKESLHDESSWTATDIVRDLYKNFPDVEFYDERDVDDNKVVLFFKIRGVNTDIDALDAKIKSYGVKPLYKGPMIKIIALEDENYYSESLKEGAEGRRDPNWEYVILDITDGDQAPIVGKRSTKVEADYAQIKGLHKKRFEDRELVVRKVPKGMFKIGDVYDTYNWDDEYFEESLTENADKSLLRESRWEYEVDKNLALSLREAIKDDDALATCSFLQLIYDDLYEKINDEDIFSEDELEQYKEDIDMIDLDDEDADEAVNYELDNFYDFCDNLNIWIAINESLKEDFQLNAQGYMLLDRTKNKKVSVYYDDTVKDIFCVDMVLLAIKDYVKKYNYFIEERNDSVFYIFNDFGAVLTIRFDFGPYNLMSIKCESGSDVFEIVRKNFTTYKDIVSTIIDYFDMFVETGHINEPPKADAEKVKTLKLMHGVMMGMNNENAYDSWIVSGVPDGASEGDYESISLDDKDYNDVVNLFNRIFKRYAKYGLFEPSQEEAQFAKEKCKELNIPEIEILEI